MAVFSITLLMVMLKNGLVWIKPMEIFTPKKDWIGKNATITWFKSKQRIILIWYVLITCFHESWIFYFWSSFRGKKIVFPMKNNSYVGILWSIMILLSGSCHFDRASNVKFSVKFWIFVIVMFFNRDRVLKFGAPSRYYKGALTQKR